MKIKLIELLNMMANGEKLPKKILFSDIVWYLLETDDGHHVYSKTGNKRDWQEYLDNKFLITKRLNEKVFILDELEKED